MGLTRAPGVSYPPNSRILDLLWKARGNGTAVNTEILQVGSSGAGPTMTAGAGALIQVVGGAPVCELTPNAADPQLSLQTAGALFTGPVLATGLTGGQNDTEVTPIYRLICRMRRRVVGGAPGAGFGMQLRLSAGGISANIGTGTGAGFALVMNGAGAWQLLVRQQIGGPLTLTLPVVWPNGDQVFTSWEMRITPPTGSADAQFTLLANGVAVFTSAFGVVGQLFPDYSGAGAPFKWMPAWAAGPVGPTDTLLIQGFRQILEAELST